MTQDTAPSIFERHLQTAIQLLLVGLLGWAGLKLVSLGEHMAVLQERQVNQGQQIEYLRRDIRDWSDLYYRKADAARDIGDIQADIGAIESRVTILEGKIP